jgi:hypothetical protein
LLIISSIYERLVPGYRGYPLPQSFYYQLGGLSVGSEIALPGALPLVKGMAPVDVTIRLGRLPESLPLPAVVDRYHHPVSSGVLLLTIPRVARYLISQGRDILVEPADDVATEEVQGFLGGWAFGSLCHQRGLLPLHASVVAVAGRGVAFMGDSGAGKSTLAAFLTRHGYPLVCDDVCVSVPTVGSALAYPGLQRLRLWPASLQALRQPADKLDRCSPQAEKRYLPLAANGQREPLPLWRIYVLQEGPVGSKPLIERVKGFAAVNVLIENTYQRRCIDPLTLTQQHFALCATLAQTVEVHRLVRPLSFDDIEEVVARLEHHWADAVPADQAAAQAA